MDGWDPVKAAQIIHEAWVGSRLMRRVGIRRCRPFHG
ncbi:hypothetical protein C4J96_3453 [Pseudomonas orientalis]|nr:hypothetical protein C4J96_3453 [Pseudomonas orientalis]